MGSDEFSLPVLDALLMGGSHLAGTAVVVGVVTQPDRPAGRGRSVAPSPVKTRARRDGVPVLQPERLRRSGVDDILSLNPDVLVVASYGQILPSSLIDAPPLRSLNLHPSLLPRYRGPSPIVSPLLAGDPETGTTLMLMAPEMDAGPILDQVAVPIGPEETGGELRDRLAGLSAELLLRDLPRWADGEIRPVPQDESRATYTRRITKEDARIDWHGPAVEIARAVRAYNPWPVAFTLWEDHPLRIWRARAEAGSAEPGVVLNLMEDGLAVGTGDGILVLQTIQMPGGKALSAQQVVRGRPALLQARFASP